MISTQMIREMYLNFFQEKGHALIPSAPLIPENDPSVLFTTAGMHPLLPYFMGEDHPLGTRLVNYQRCLRTGDIASVGDAVHLTFFEMLGNWSLGDYFKEESIAYSFEFLFSPHQLALPQERIFVSVFAGDAHSPRDEESAAIWRKLGIKPSHLFYLSKDQNWWGPVGTQGPCGPDTEIFFQRNQRDCGPSCAPGCSCGKYVEIWNNVFLQYFQSENTQLRPLEKRYVDTGMGLERITAVLNARDSVYQTDVFAPLMQILRRFSPGEFSRSHRLIADHVKSSVFLLGETPPVLPTRSEQGYVLRRLIRKAVYAAQTIAFPLEGWEALINQVVAIYQDIYPSLSLQQSFIVEQFHQERAKFLETLSKGKKEWEKILNQIPSSTKILSGESVFYLYETFGFPLDLTEELAKEQGLQVDHEGIQRASLAHQKVSKQNASFAKGGLTDSSQDTVRLHTATHLLHKALQVVLGPHALQRGSHITQERLRFDFSHPQKLSPQELQAVETLVNEKIQENLPISKSLVSLEEARQKGATALFADKYGDHVYVYQMGDFSLEVCGGPHASSTGELGHFRILKEEASSKGIRRIKAQLDPLPSHNPTSS